MMSPQSSLVEGIGIHLKQDMGVFIGVFLSSALATVLFVGRNSSGRHRKERVAGQHWPDGLALLGSLLNNEADETLFSSSHAHDSPDILGSTSLGNVSQGQNQKALLDLIKGVGAVCTWCDEVDWGTLSHFLTRRRAMIELALITFYLLVMDDLNQQAMVVWMVAAFLMFVA
jgi:hypothetical protein